MYEAVQRAAAVGEILERCGWSPRLGREILLGFGFAKV
jgi:hypothetical protein